MHDVQFWKQLQRKVLINRPPDEIFFFLATANGLQQWLFQRVQFTNADGIAVPLADVPDAGAFFEWKWMGKAREERGKISGLSRTVYINYAIEETKTSISFRIDHRGDASLVTFTQQHSFPTESANREAFLKSQGAWTFYLANLKSVLEGGIDLRSPVTTGEKDLIQG